MPPKRKVIKTLRCRNRQSVGNFAKLASVISSCGVDLGDIRTISLSSLHSVRDITVICDNEKHLETVIQAIHNLPDVTLEAVIDEVLEVHQGGKIQVTPKREIKSVEDLRKVYTPGVASVCQLIQEDKSQAAHYTMIKNTVALVTNGSRVLGLGNIGLEAAMPVMEGKAALFHQLSGMNMFPILLDTLDVDIFVNTVEKISRGFGAIQLEDIQNPECFEIERRLIERLDIPVMHDDQHGTAVVTLAAAINACRIANFDFRQMKVGQLGLGSAGSAIARLMMKHTGKPVMAVDSNPEMQKRFQEWGGIVGGSVEEVMKTCDLVIATTGRNGLIRPEMIHQGHIILALSNPEPEISREEALAAGAAFASDGTRVNNLLGYPGILKGALKAKAKSINEEMYIAASMAIVQHTPENELVPDALDRSLHEHVASAVIKAAIRSGVCA